jgi:hypothetical protein
MGVDSNIKQVIQDIFSGETETYIPTGFKSFDNFNIGLPRGELFYASAPSSHLKTIVLWQLAMNMATYGAKVCYVPLEMNERQMTRRHLANISRIPLINFLNAKRLNAQQQRFVWNQLQEFEKRLRTVGTRLSILTPDGGIELDEALNLITPHGYNVVILDYISLFSDANDEREMWKQLGRMAWRAKVWASNNNALVGLGAQLNDDLTVRYARAINEHASNAWRWVYDKVARETGIILVEQPKSRMQNPRPFELKVEPEFMRARDLTPQEQGQSRMQPGGKQAGGPRPKQTTVDLEQDYYQA